MVNFGYPYNDIVICNDSTDYLQVLHIPNPLMFIQSLCQIFQNTVIRRVQVRVVWWHILWFNTLIQSVMSNKNPVFCSNSMFLCMFD